MGDGFVGFVILREPEIDQKLQVLFKKTGDFNSFVQKWKLEFWREKIICNKSLEFGKQEKRRRLKSGVQSEEREAQIRIVEFQIRG